MNDIEDTGTDAKGKPLEPRIGSADALALTLAREIVEGMRQARAHGRHYVLGCPGGRTPRPVYRALAREVARQSLPLDHVVVAMMDEYVVHDVNGRAVAAEPTAHYSCRRFGREEIVGPLNAATPGGQIPDTQLWLPDPAAPERYDRRLLDAGGVDLFLLACGASDGHVAFNPPGSEVHSRTRVVRLAEATRRDNLGTFPQFASLDEVPAHGVSVGIETIAALSRCAVMLVFGAHKREAFTRLRAARGYDPDWPATVILRCHRAGLYADPGAAGLSSVSATDS